jgi:hypothetical protein
MGASDGDGGNIMQGDDSEDQRDEVVKEQEQDSDLEDEKSSTFLSGNDMTTLEREGIKNLELCLESAVRFADKQLLKVKVL